MNTNSGDIQQKWWKGVELWYNQQDYLAAMDVWWESVENILVEWTNETNGSWTEQEPLNDQQHQQVAPLLLFLAGCYLDAGQFQKARALLTTCLLTTKSPSREGALQEYLACLQEDSSVQEPWVLARQVMEWAILDPEFPTMAHDKYQRAAFLYPSIPSRAVYSEQPSWCKALEDNWRIIRDDYELLCRNKAHWPAVGSGDHRDGAGAHDGSVVEGGAWKEIVLFGSGAQPQLAPRTAHLVQELVPDAVDLAEQGGGEVIFSQLQPHTRIQPHCASTNVRLTAHLGLKIPSNKCRIRIADSECTWQEGKMLVFDDSFEHEVLNDSNETRAVLLLRFWHVNLPPAKRQEALQQALLYKENDKLRRYNPPLPIPNRQVEDRITERTRCPRCWQTGFQTLRLVENRAAPIFGCSCGTGIE